MTWRVATPTVMNTSLEKKQFAPLRINGAGRGNFVLGFGLFSGAREHVDVSRSVLLGANTVERIFKTRDSKELDNWSHKNCKTPEKQSMCLGHYITNPSISHFWWLNSQISSYDTTQNMFFANPSKTPCILSSSLIPQIYNFWWPLFKVCFLFPWQNMVINCVMLMV